MSKGNGTNRRELLGTIGMAGLTAVGAALLPAAAHAGLKDYPALAKGHEHLMEAKRVLENGKEAFGGHRIKAIKLIEEALEEVRKGVKSADGK
jgi:hypothetical protein